MSEPWNIVILGDSWAQYMHPTWPEVIAHQCRARCYNFASGGSVSAELPAQVQRVRTALASGAIRSGGVNTLPPRTLIMIHTGGNDFIQKIAGMFMGGFLGGGGGGPNLSNTEILQPNPGQNEARNVKQAIEGLYGIGARNFVISGVPVFKDMPVFNFVWPLIGGLINSNQLEAIGVTRGDPPQLAIEVQAAALNDRWEGICNDMTANVTGNYPDCKVVFFNEVDGLHRVKDRIGNQAIWDMTMFHPSVRGHQELAQEVMGQIQGKFEGLVPTGFVAPSANTVPGNTVSPSAVVPDSGSGGTASGRLAVFGDNRASVGSTATTNPTANSSAPANASAIGNTSGGNAASSGPGGNCKGGCGFFGNPATDGYCSQCFKKQGGVTQTTASVATNISAANMAAAATAADTTSAARESSSPKRLNDNRDCPHNPKRQKSNDGKTNEKMEGSYTDPRDTSSAGSSSSSLNLRLRNVAGNVDFTIKCPPTATLCEFQALAIEACPMPNKDNLNFTFVHKNKLLKSTVDQTVSHCGFCDNDMVVMVTKAKS